MIENFVKFFFLKTNRVLFSEILHKDIEPKQPHRNIKLLIFSENITFTFYF